MNDGKDGDFLDTEADNDININGRAIYKIGFAA